MRHTHATPALQRGAALTTVRDNLRHASLSTTSMVLHADDLRRAKQIGWGGRGAGSEVLRQAQACQPGQAARDRVADTGVLLYSAATVAAVFAPNVWTLAPALALSGAVRTVNTLTMTAQLVLPENLRARAAWRSNR